MSARADRTGSGPRRPFLRAAWTLAIALAAVLVVKIFVGDVKHVDSGSMAPTILGSREDGESVLVLYGAFEPERFDFAVITLEGESVPLVKRIVGLPTESVRIANGDLLIDGRRLPPSAPRPAPVAVFDDRFQSVAEGFERPRGEDARWTRGSAEWSLDARDLAPDSDAGLMTFHRRLSDGYLDRDGSSVAGEVDVHDGIFECEVRLGDPPGRTIVDLVEQGDDFRFVLEPRSPGTAQASIVRRGAGGPEETLATRLVTLAPGAWTKVRCSNVDNALAFEVSGAPEALCAEYAENRYDAADRLKEGKTYGPRARFGGTGGRLEIRSIRVLRDLEYTPRDVHGVKTPADLGPDEYFVLGDHSAESRDSREWGPVRRARIVGRPVAVVWPLSHARWLSPTVPGPCGR